MDTQGVIIIDTDRRICVLSPGAESLLDWRALQVWGLTCSVVLDCRGADGEPLCTTCGINQALERHELTSSVVMRMADPSGGRRAMATSFWYLPPSGKIFAPRAMAVLTSTS